MMLRSLYLISKGYRQEWGLLSEGNVKKKHMDEGKEIINTIFPGI